MNTPSPPLFFIEASCLFFNCLFVGKTHFQSPQSLQHFSVVRFEASAFNKCGVARHVSVIAKFKPNALTGCTEVAAQILSIKWRFLCQTIFAINLVHPLLSACFACCRALLYYQPNCFKNEECKSFLQAPSLEPADAAPNSKCKAASCSGATQDVVKCLLVTAVLAEKWTELTFKGQSTVQPHKHLWDRAFPDSLRHCFESVYVGEHECIALNENVKSLRVCFVFGCYAAQFNTND